MNRFSLPSISRYYARRRERQKGPVADDGATEGSQGPVGAGGSSTDRRGGART
jgi:hypothetical protein